MAISSLSSMSRLCTAKSKRGFSYMLVVSYILQMIWHREDVVDYWCHSSTLWCTKFMLHERGPNQHKLWEEIIAQEWQDEHFQCLRPNIFYLILTQSPICQFWLVTLDLIHSFDNGLVFVHLPLVPMPFYHHEALLPLPATPHARFCPTLSLYAKIIEATPKLKDIEDVPLPLGKKNFAFYCCIFSLFFLTFKILKKNINRYGVFLVPIHNN